MNMFGGEIPFNPPFELDNRSKRSIVIDLGNPVGLAVAHELIEDADVFLTQRPTRRARTTRPRSRLAHGPLPASRLLRGHGFRRHRPGARPRRVRHRRVLGPFGRRLAADRARRRAAVPAGRDGRPRRGDVGGGGGVRGARVARADREGPARLDVAAASRRLHGRIRREHLGAAGVAGRDRHPLHDGQPAHQLVPATPTAATSGSSASRATATGPICVAPSAAPSGSRTSVSPR